jgi:hypothetical protein
MISTPEEAHELLQALLAGRRLQRSDGGGDPFGGWDTWSEEVRYDQATQTFVRVFEETRYYCATETTRTELPADQMLEFIGARFSKKHLW